MKKMWSRVLSERIHDKSVLRGKIEGVVEGYQGGLGHVSVFCVPIRIRRTGINIVERISNQRGLSPQDLEVCLVFEKKDKFTKADGTEVVKPEGWGLVGGGVDISDILNDGGKRELSLTKQSRNAVVCELLKGLKTDDLLDVIQNALYREAREEAGLTIAPFWGLCKVDSKEEDDGAVSIVVTVLAEVLEISEAIDKKEIKEKRFFLPEEIIANIKAAPPIKGMPRWVYVSHARRLRKMFTFLGRGFEGLVSSLEHMFGKY